MNKSKIAIILLVALTIAGCGKVNGDGVKLTDQKIKSVEEYRKSANEACDRSSFTTALKELDESQFKSLKDSLGKLKAPKELESIQSKLQKDIDASDKISAISVVTAFAKQMHLEKCLRSSEINAPQTPETSSPPNSTPNTGTSSGGGGGGSGNNPAGGGVNDESPTLINGFTVTKDRATWRSYFKRINSGCTSLRMAKETIIEDLTTLQGGAVVNGSSLTTIYQDLTDLGYALDDLGSFIDSVYAKSSPDGFDVRKDDAIKNIKSVLAVIEKQTKTVGDETFKSSPDLTKILSNANKSIADLTTLQPFFVNLGMTDCP